MIERNFNLHLTAGHSTALVINVNQFDQGEKWIFTLYNENGTQYIPSTGAIVGIKSDGLGIINSGSVVDGKVVIMETEQMTAAVGKAVFELMIDSQTHGTANFIVLVEPKPGNNADLSESDLSLLQEAIDATSPLPTGGSVGQVLTKTASGSAWSDAGTPTQEQVADAVSDWADEHITVSTGVVIDTSLAVAGAAADAKKVGDEISGLKSQTNAIAKLYDVPLTWGQGTINGTTGKNGDSESSKSTRRRTDNYFSFPKTIVYSKAVVTIAEGWGGQWYKYSGANINTFVKSGLLASGQSEFDIETGYYRFITKMTSEETISNDVNLDEIFSVKYYGLNVDDTLTQSGIPADAKTVGKNINNFKEAFGTMVSMPLTWSQGTIGDDTGKNSTSTERNQTRRRTDAFYKFPVHFDDYCYVNIEDGWQGNLYYYTSASVDNYVGSSVLPSGESTFLIESGYYRFIVKRTDEATIGNIDVSTKITVSYLGMAVEDNSDIVSLNDPIKTVNLLNQMNRPWRVSGTTFKTNPFVMIHCSDIHADSVNLRRIIEYKNAYSAYINGDILHTGDIVDEFGTESVEWWGDVDGSENVLNCLGNHDTRTGTNGSPYTWVSKDEATCFTDYFADYIANWNVTYTENKCYYYKDYPTYNVRLIVLDVMHSIITGKVAEPVQLAWFKDALTGAASAGYHVIVAGHTKIGIPLTSVENTAWDDKWRYGTPDNSENRWVDTLHTDYTKAINYFINQENGIFICYLHGHTHYKMLATMHISNEDGESNLLNIAVSNAGNANAETSITKRVTGTKSQDEFNVIAIDTYTKIIKLMAVGADCDMLMRIRSTLCWNYGTGSLVWTG